MLQIMCPILFKILAVNYKVAPNMCSFVALINSRLLYFFAGFCTSSVDGKIPLKLKAIDLQLYVAYARYAISTT